MRLSDIVATSKPVKRGEIYVALSAEAMEGIKDKIGSVPITIGHNPMCMPLGKTEGAWVEYTSDGETLLHQDIYLVSDEPDIFIHESSQVRCVHISFTESPQKFSLLLEEDRSVTVDYSAIRSESHELLVDEVHDYDDGIKLEFHDRREDLPIVLIRFVTDMSLAETLVTTVKLALLSAAVTGRLTRWVEDTVKWVKNDCIPVLNLIRRHKTEAAKAKDFEWIVLAFDATGSKGPLIELVIPSTQDSEIPEIAIVKFMEAIRVFADVLDECDKVVFAYHADEERCELRYALTKTGGVIGTETSYEEAAPSHKRWLATRAAGTAIWWTLVNLDGGELALRLYSLNEEPPRLLGDLYVSPDTASVLLERFQPDDGILHPLHGSQDSEE